MKTVNGTLASIVVVLGVFSVPAMGQQKTLYIVDSDGNELEQVTLDEGSTVDLLADGVRARASDYSCSAAADCEAAVEILPFTVDGVSSGGSLAIEQGETLQFNWGTRGAWECEAGGLPNSSWNSSNKSLNGTQNVSTSNVTVSTNPYNAFLTCRNCGDLQTSSCGVEQTSAVSITVQEATSEPEPSPEGCENVPSLADQPNWAPALDVVWGSRDPDPNSYEQVFGAPLGGASASTIDFYLSEGRFASMQFQTPASMNSKSEGGWGFVEHKPTFSGGSENKLISISSCPGVFDPQYIEADCIKALRSLSGTFKFVGPGHEKSSYMCELQAGETYYLNIVYTDSVIGETPVPSSSCNGSLGCGNEMQPTGFNGF